MPACNWKSGNGAPPLCDAALVPASSESTGRSRRTQTERREQSRNALLEAAARGISRRGYAALTLNEVAREAGYTRGALYHQFTGKEELAEAVVNWIEQSWDAEIGHLLTSDDDPVEVLFAVARGHAIYSRREISRAMRYLEVEFRDPTHPVGAAVQRVIDRLIDRCADLVAAAQRSGRVPTEPDARSVALAIISSLEAVAIELEGKSPVDTELAERVVRGLLAMPPGDHPTET